MTYRIFIDDERFPPENEEWVICRSLDSFVNTVRTLGFPAYISFDHDLGDDVPTGHDIAKWMVEADLDSEMALIPAEFSFYVHSQNPVGAANITGTLAQYLSWRKR